MRKRFGLPGLAALALALTVGMANRAGATIGNACEVKETPDGFVAIRAKPSAKAALVSKAKPGQLLEIQQGKNRKPVASGLWWRVRHYPGDTALSPGDKDYHLVRDGWIHSKLVGDCG